MTEYSWKFLDEYEHVREAFDTTHDEQYDMGEYDIEEFNEDTVLSNRQKRQKPKQGLSWCGKCDSNLVGWGSKCEDCGYRNGAKRFKK